MTLFDFIEKHFDAFQSLLILIVIVFLSWLVNHD